MQTLIDNPLLALTLTVGLGSAFGLIKFGPLRFGAAGALFVGLFIGAFDEDKVFNASLGLLKTFALALFVYTIGLAAGRSLVRSLRTQANMLVANVVVLGIVAGATVLIGLVFPNVFGTYQGGAYSGVGTSTGALGAAQAAAVSAAPSDAVAQDWSGQVAVGYSIAYPFGVIIGILVVFVAYRRSVASTPTDPQLQTGGLVDLTVAVSRPTLLREVPGAVDGAVRFSFLARDAGGSAGHSVGIATATDRVEPGDRVVIIGNTDAVNAAVAFLGSRADEHLAHDRRVVDYRRILLSNPEAAERTVAELDLPGRFGALVTRVRRGDVDILATEDLVLLPGDRLRVVAPRERMKEVSEFLGDTERKISEVDAIALFIGLALGFLIGIPGIPVGDATVSLGSAGGPIIMGIILGAIGRTGPIVWEIPLGANLTLRQYGLLVFLAGVGLSSGYDFRTNAFTTLGLQIFVLSVAIAVFGLVLMMGWSRVRGTSTPREAGLLAGFVGNPSILAYATSRSSDPRVGEGYSTLFAVSQVFKIIIAQFIVVAALPPL
jgi:putative transport protein